MIHDRVLPTTEYFDFALAILHDRVSNDGVHRKNLKANKVDQRPDEQQQLNDVHKQLHQHRQHVR